MLKAGIKADAIARKLKRTVGAIQTRKSHFKKPRSRSHAPDLQALRGGSRGPAIVLDRWFRESGLIVAIVGAWVGWF
jgi:hypothetical protein